MLVVTARLFKDNQLIGYQLSDGNQTKEFTKQQAWLYAKNKQILNVVATGTEDDPGLSGTNGFELKKLPEVKFDEYFRETSDAASLYRKRQGLKDEEIQKQLKADKPAMKFTTADMNANWVYRKIENLSNKEIKQQLSLENYNEEKENKRIQAYENMSPERLAEHEKRSFESILGKADLTEKEFIILLNATDGCSYQEKTENLIQLIENSYKRLVDNNTNFEKVIYHVRQSIKNNSNYKGILSNNLNETVELKDVLRLLGYLPSDFEDYLQSIGLKITDLTEVFFKMNGNTRYEKAQNLEKHIYSLPKQVKSIVKTSIFNMFKR